MKVVFILGATSVGKSTLALQLARSFRESSIPVALLSLDAMQVYSGADVGTSKPSPAERSEFPYGGLDLVRIGSNFTVADFLQHARTFLQGHPGHQIIAVGGTGLYFRALTRGLCLAPESAAPLRSELSTLSLAELQTRLRSQDPAIYEKLDQKNPRRLIRAIEVKESTGRSLLDWQAETPPPLVADFQAFHLQRPRPELYERISTRVEEMVAQGWVREAQELLRQYGEERLEKFPALGYRQIIQECLKGGETSLSRKIVNDIVQETQQFAKRQLTWFAREPSLVEINPNRTTIGFLRQLIESTSPH